MEKKKRHPNWIDIAFIVLLVAVVAVAYILSHSDSAATVETVKRSYVVELTNLDPHMADCLTVGDKVTDNVKNYDIGTVTALEVVPYENLCMDEEDGVMRAAQIPDKITLQVTIEADTTETERQIATASGYTLRVGTSVSCTIGQLTAAGYIIGLDR